MVVCCGKMWELWFDNLVFCLIVVLFIWFDDFVVLLILLLIIVWFKVLVGFGILEFWNEENLWLVLVLILLILVCFIEDSEVFGFFDDLSILVVLIFELLELEFDFELFFDLLLLELFFVYDLLVFWFLFFFFNIGVVGILMFLEGMVLNGKSIFLCKVLMFFFDWFLILKIGMLGFGIFWIV